MLLVKTKIGPSKIQGSGLFAAEFISKGTLIWKFAPGFDMAIDKTEVEKLPEIARKTFLRYAPLHPIMKKYILSFDDARFFNHSENPNVESTWPNGSEATDVAVAARDIEEGEELTENYKEYDATFDYKMKN